MANSEFIAKIKKPNYISDELIKTIDMIASARDSQLGFDKTVIAKIITTGKIDIGEYWVEYQQGRFKAYASTIAPNINYSPGSSVYVKIPNGDFSQKKIIEGLAMENVGLEEYFDYDHEQLNEIWKIYENEKEYGIIAGAQPENIYYEQIIYENNEEYENKDFKSVFESYPNLKIQAEFKTDFKGDAQLEGNYGLLIEFYQTDNDGNLDINKTFRLYLDRTNFTGSNIEYDTFSSQYAVYNIQNSNLTNIKKITFFQKNFQYDSFGNLINDYKPNIFIRNIKITFNEIQDQSESLWTMYIKPVGYKGFHFTQPSEKITYQGVLTYMSENKLEKETCECLWFKLNPEVTLGSEKYNSYSGPGWERITNETVNFNQITINGNDVYQKTKYKLVIVYDKKRYFEKEIELTSDVGWSRFVFIKKKEEDGTFLTLEDGRNYDKKNPTTADWYAVYPNGYEQCGTGVNKINIDAYLGHPWVQFIANITITQDEKLRKVIYYEEYKNDNLKGTINVTFAGPDTFLYDTSGNITYNESKEEMVIIPSIIADDGVVITDVTWKGPGGVILSTMAATNVNSMLEDVWVDDDNRVHFKIRKTFAVKRNQNTLLLTIETFDGNTFTFNKKISFLKQGEQTTGGLNYTLVVEQCDVEGNEINYSPLLCDENGENWTTIYLRPQIYANGSIIKSGDSAYEGATYTIKFNTQSINVKLTEIKDKGYYAVTRTSKINDNEKGQYFVRFEGIITLKSADKQEEIIVNHYHPILIGVGHLAQNSLIINNLPNNVLYSSTGTNPTFNNQPIDVQYSGSSQTTITAPKSLTPNTINISVLDLSKYCIYPVETYSGANFTLNSTDNDFKTMGAIKIILSGFMNNNTYIIQPIAMTLSTQATQSLKGYDGTSILAVDEEDAESIKEITNVSGVGDLGYSNGANDTISTGAIIGKDKKTENVGFYTYDKDGNPNNYITSEGKVSLGNEAIKVQNSTVSIKNDSLQVTKDTVSIKNQLSVGANNVNIKDQISVEEDEEAQSTLVNIKDSISIKEDKRNNKLLVNIKDFLQIEENSLPNKTTTFTIKNLMSINENSDGSLTYSIDENFANALKEILGGS